MTLDLSTLYAATGTAKLADLPAYEARVKELVPPAPMSPSVAAARFGSTCGWPMRCTVMPGSCSMIHPSRALWKSSIMTRVELRGELRIADCGLRI